MNISFSVKEHTIFGILGSNCAGKTTLIKLLSGLMKPTHGEIIINGLNFQGNSEQINKILE